MNTEVQFCQLERSKIAYLDFGQGPPLLLVHGFPLNRSMWDWQHPLSEHYRLLIPDLPGFGESSFSGTELALEETVKQIIQWLDAIEVEKVIFCGLSMGGYLGWRFWKDYHQRLGGLIACNTRAAGDNPTVLRARQIAAESVRQNGVAGLAEEMLPRLFASISHDRHPSRVAKVRQMILSSDPERVAQAQLAMAARPDATDWLSQIQVPMLFIAGQFDQITPSAEMQANCQCVPKARWVEIPESGHLSPLENPSAFNKALIDFKNWVI